MSESISRQHSDRQPQIQIAFQRGLGRPATKDELALAERLWGVGEVENAKVTDPLIHLCLSLFNSNEFVFID